MTRFKTAALLLLLGIYSIGASWSPADEKSTTKTKGEVSKTAASKANAKTRADQQKSLSAFAGLIGEWRGVGQPRRGSNRGAWSEKAEWIWDFSKPQVAIAGIVAKGKLTKSIQINNGHQPGQFVVEVKSVDDTITRFNAKLDDKKLVGESAADKDGHVHRIKVTLLNSKRTLVLLEKRKSGQSFFSRIAEVGYTRAGTSLAGSGSTGPICVVTGGKGTIKVKHKGKTYYVCCTGCKSAFEDDPEGLLADYRESLKKKKAKAKS